MTSLHKNQVKFNSNITISHTGGQLSSDSGLVLVKELMNIFGFYELAKQHIHTRSDLHHRRDSLHLAACLLRLRHIRLSDQRCALSNFEASMHRLPDLQTRSRRPMSYLRLRREPLLLARDHDHGRLLRLQRLHHLCLSNQPTKPKHSRDGRLHLHQPHELR